MKISCGEHLENIGKKDITDCESKTFEHESWGPWKDWTNCDSKKCGQRGQMLRTRICNPGSDGKNKANIRTLHLNLTLR